MNSKVWTRREFGQAAAAVAGAAVARGTGLAQLAQRHDGLAFVGSKQPGQPELGSIHVFRTGSSRWTALGTVQAAAPAHLLVHPTMPVLYAVHQVDTWGNLPRGAVSAYRVDRTSGGLHLLGTQPLSLSATHPRHAVVTAGASHLFVAAEGGGIYNLLPLAADGTPLPPSAIRKEPGNGWSTETSSPHTVALHPDGSLLAADAGHETVTRFRVVNGALEPAHRLRVHHGQGPAGFALTPDGSRMYTLARDGKLTASGLHASGFSGEHTHYQVPAGIAHLALAQGGHQLLAAGGGLTLQFALDPQTGTLGQPATLDLAAPGGLYTVADGEVAIGLNPSTGHVTGISTVTRNRAQSRPRVLASVPGCATLAFLHLPGAAI